jgi:hypothetical protein
LKERRTWSQVYWALIDNNFSPGILYPTKLSLKIDRAIKIFLNNQKLKQCMTSKPPLQKTLQGILYTEEESKQNHKRTESIKPQEKKRQVIIGMAAHIEILKQHKQLKGRNQHKPLKTNNTNTECQ